MVHFLAFLRKAIKNGAFLKIVSAIKMSTV